MLNLGDKAQRAFAQMPPDLFDTWIKPEIDSRGWPFSDDAREFSDPAWARFLRCLGPEYWSRVQWNRVSQPFIGIPIEKRAMNIARQLCAVGRKFLETGIVESTLVKDSPQKVVALASAIRNMGTFPKPVVCVVHGNEWWLMDGHHRLGALIMLGPESFIPFDCWLGTHAL